MAGDPVKWVELSSLQVWRTNSCLEAHRASWAQIGRRWLGTMTGLWLTLGSIGVFIFAVWWAWISGRQDRRLATRSKNNRLQDLAD